MFFHANDVGYCWNTESRNKNARTHTCDQVATATDGVLNYHFGDVKALKDHPDPRGERPITPCTPRGDIVSGTYDIGRKPSIALYRQCEGSSCRPAMLLVHETLEDAEKSEGSQTCGATDRRFGSPAADAVVVGWPLKPLWRGVNSAAVPSLQQQSEKEDSKPKHVVDYEDVDSEKPTAIVFA